MLVTVLKTQMMVAERVCRRGVRRSKPPPPPQHPKASPGTQGRWRAFFLDKKRVVFRK